MTYDLNPRGADGRPSKGGRRQEEGEEEGEDRDGRGWCHGRLGQRLINTT
jgi:hypothetical protein